MKQNRRRSQKMSVIAVRSIYVVICIVSVAVSGIINLCASTTCKQLEKDIGLKERKIASLENDRKRTSAAWERMKSQESLDAALLSHGLFMKTAKAEQVVRMKDDAKPYPGQLSLVWARERFTGTRSAMVNTRRR